MSDLQKAKTTVTNLKKKHGMNYGYESMGLEDYYLCKWAVAIIEKNKLIKTNESLQK